jgi:excisionase family DNA binding protein
MDAQTTETAALAVPENKPLTADLAAEFLGFSKGYLYKLVAANKVAYYRPALEGKYFIF